MIGRANSQLFERDEQVRQLCAAVEAAAAGHSSAVVLTGEAGIGKTSVVRAFLGEVGAGARIVNGACDDLLAARALGALRDAFRGTGGPVERALDSGATDATFDALTAELAGAQPTVLVLEDLHWADDATLDLLRYVGRRLDRVRAVLVLTFRDDAVDTRHPLRALLSALPPERCQRIALEPLSPAAVRSLARGSGRDPAELHALTRGNPFYLTEALAGPADGVTPTVVDAVLARAGRLGAAGLAVVEQLSVVPTHLELDTARELLGDRPGTLDALAEAERAGVLRMHHDGIGFRHEIARRAIEHSLPAIRRQALNATVVGLLKTRPDLDVTWLVHHAAAAGDTDTLLAHAPLAARQATRAGSHRQALAHYEAVLPYADRLAPAARAELLDDYAWELHIAHRFAAAVEAGRQAIALREQAGTDEAGLVALAETLLRVSRHLYMAGDTAAAREATERAGRVATAVGTYDAGARALLAATTVYRGMMFALTGCPAEAVPVLEHGRTLAAAAGRTDLVSLCLNYLGVAFADLGDPRGLPYLRDSLATATRHGDHESAARGYTNLAEVLYRQGRTDELADCVERGVEFTCDRGFWSHLYNLELHQALVCLRRGDWAGADEILRRLDAVNEPGMLFVYSAPVLGRLRARRGELDAAEQLLAEAWHRSWRQRSMVGILYTAIGYAEWAWLSDRPDVAEAIRQRLALDEYQPMAGIAHLVGELFGYLARAGVAAEPHAGVSRPWPDRIDDPYERALALADTGSVESTLEGLELLDDLGATAAARLVRAKLRELGVRRIPRGARPSTRKNPAGLTSRQLDVLRLIAGGLTNAEIAEHLVVSVRTVDHHVSAVLDKLGARSRREAAAAADSLGLAPA